MTPAKPGVCAGLLVTCGRDNRLQLIDPRTYQVCLGTSQCAIVNPKGAETEAQHVSTCLCVHMMPADSCPRMNSILLASATSSMPLQHLSASHAAAVHLQDNTLLMTTNLATARQARPHEQSCLVPSVLLLLVQVQRSLNDPRFTVDSTWCSPCLSSDDLYAVSGSGSGSIFIWQVLSAVPSFGLHV